MTRRAATTLLVALVVVLAGCGGGQGTPGPGDTETATAAPFGGDAPPGIDAGGVSDVDALMAAHAAALNGTSSTVDVAFHLTHNGSGENVSLRAKVVPGSDRGWLRAELGSDVGTYYTEDGTTYFREVVDERARYGTTDDFSAIPETPRFGADERIRTAVESADWEPVGTVERDGRTLYELRATAVDPPDVNTSGDVDVDASGRLLVDGDGVVHHVSVDTTVEDGAETVRYGIEVSFTDVGETTIERPSWYENAANS